MNCWLCFWAFEGVLFVVWVGFFLISGNRQLLPGSIRSPDTLPTITSTEKYLNVHFGVFAYMKRFCPCGCMQVFSVIKWSSCGCLVLFWFSNELRNLKELHKLVNG